MDSVVYYFILAILAGLVYQYSAYIHFEFKSWDKEETYLGMVIYLYHPHNERSLRLKRQTFIGWGWDDHTPFSVFPKYYKVLDKRVGWRYSLLGFIVETRKTQH